MPEGRPPPAGTPFPHPQPAKGCHAGPMVVRGVPIGRLGGFEKQPEGAGIGNRLVGKGLRLLPRLAAGDVGSELGPVGSRNPEEPLLELDLLHCAPDACLTHPCYTS